MRDMADFMGSFVVADCSSINRNGFGYKGQHHISLRSLVNLL